MKETKHASEPKSTLIAQVLALFEPIGYDLIEQWEDARSINLTLHRKAKHIWVRVRKKDEKVSAEQVDKFLLAIEQQTDRALSGCFVSLAGFTKAALTQVQRDASERLMLLSHHKGKLESVYPYQQQPSSVEKPKQRPLYIGVFTAKGGVGKTTIAGHLAGAFALMGESVVLLDCDPDKNLRKLFSQDGQASDAQPTMLVPAVNRHEAGALIRVLDPEQWRESKFPEVGIVIVDCSPVMSENSAKLVKRFDICVMPTTLNPLGIAKHADVMTRTFAHIRALNQTAQLMAVINNYDASKDAQKRNDVLLAYLQSSLADYFKTDHNAQLIPPDKAKIRHSNALQYWGYHIIEKSAPQLAFKETAGRSYPRSDFLQLADYLEAHVTLMPMISAAEV